MYFFCLEDLKHFYRGTYGRIIHHVSNEEFLTIKELVLKCNCFTEHFFVSVETFSFETFKSSLILYDTYIQEQAN